MTRCTRLELTVFVASTLFASLLCSPTHADDTAYLPVGQARTKKSVIAYPEIRGATGRNEGPAKVLHETVTSDLNFMDFFKFIEPAGFIEDASKAGIAPESFKMTDWTSIGTDFLIKSQVSNDKPGNLIYETHVYDTHGAKEILAKRYISTASEVKTLAHTFANDLVKTLTGLPGIFLTKIAMSCDRGNKKEIYIMNFDGSDVKQATHHRSIAFAPTWHPDGIKMVYSLFTKNRNNIKNIDLYELDFRTSTIRLLSNRKGINSGAAYSPDGKTIALTMSFLGNPEIFTLEPPSPKVTRLTKSYGFDVDPAWSPDGKTLAFVSSRTGMPMVFSMKLDGSDLKRLTYAGRYNATPTWSPTNNKMAFAGWIDNTFDIFLMNPDGTNIERLTKNQGNNEDPYFSPDGNFVIFSSNRTGQKNIYVMNVDGTFVRRLTYGLGNCVTPKWSNPPKQAPSISNG